jgi:hypothetical protein
MSYTWAQGMFFYCGAVIAPVAGFFAARQAKERLGRTVLQFLVGMCSVWGCLVLGALVVRTLHPAYPSKPESEWLIIAFTLPALVVALLAWRFFPTRDSSADSPVLRRSLSLLFLYMVGIAITFTFFAWPYRQRLPWMAYGVRDSAIEELFLPDFAYFMRARIPREEYLKYVQKYGLSEDTTAAPQAEEPRVAWWQPPRKPELTYTRVDRSWRMTADFFEGVMHVQVTLGASAE